MFAEYDTSQFPLVNIQLGNTIKDNEDYEHFVRQWTKLYLLKKEFLFIIDARMTGFVPFQYAYKMSDFITKLKNMENVYLKRSIIIIHNCIVEYTLLFIFKMSNPTTPVYLVYSMDDAPLYHKATFALTHECKQVQADDEVCVGLTSGKTALYAPKEG